MRYLKKALSVTVVLAMLLTAAPAAFAQEPVDSTVRINPVSGLISDFIMGADVSMLNDIEKYGGKFYDIGSSTPEDSLQIMKAHGINWIRLRLWNDPVTDENGKVGADTVMIDGNPAPAGTPAGAGTCDEATTIATAKKAKALGMKVLLDFHYSDFWADPGKQAKPKAWKDLTGAALQDAVYNYTKQVLQNMKDQGVMPDMVQIGNETNNGMMFPEGKTDKGFAGWIGLINAASKAIREVSASAGTQTKIMIHLANGGDNSLYRKVFDKLTNFSNATDYVPADDKYNDGKTGIDFDVIGFSYYPFWHGKLDTFRQNMLDVAQRYGKEVAVAEIGYGYTYENGDNAGNAFGPGSDELSGYQATVQGQAQLLRDVMEVVSQAKDSAGNNTGIGVFYWEPEWIPVLDSNGDNQVGWITGGGNDSENRALFDFTGHALPSLDVFNLVKKSVSELPGGKLYTYEITNLRSSSITVTVAQKPDLPDTVLADYSDGTIRSVPVHWDNPAQADLNKLHTFTLNGTVEGTSIKAILNITVIGKTNYVQDPGFESGNLSNWSVMEASSSDVETKNESSPGNNAYTGNNCFSYYISPNASGFTIQQTVTGLPNGAYTLKAVSHGGDTAPDTGTLSRYMFVNGYGGDEKTVSFTNTGWRNWVFPEIRNITVTNGTATIGVRVDNAGAGTWGKLDDFELYPDLSAANLTLPYSITPGSQFDAELSYSKLINNVYAQDVTIDYNPAKVQFLSATPADDGILITGTDTSVPGKVRILAADTNPGGISWDSDSLKLSFRAKAGAGFLQSDITISKALLGLSDGSVAEPANLATLRAPAPVDDDDSDGNNGSDNNGNGGSNGNVPPASNGNITVKPPVVSNGVATADVDKSTLDSAAATVPADKNGVKTITVTIPEIEGQTSYEIRLPASSLSTDGLSQKIKVSTSVGSVTLPSNMLAAAGASSAGKVGLKISSVNTDGLDNEVKAQIGGRPVIELALNLDGKAVAWNNPDAPVTVSIPYKPSAEELKSPGHIVVWYMDGNGKAVSVPNGRYDPATGQVTFTTTHFSKYAVAYSVKTFTDVGRYGWAKDAIDIMASRGVVEGDGKELFIPAAKVTRADFMVMLVNSLGLSARFSDSFSDVKETDYYYNAAGIAKKLGISDGTGGSRFSPKAYITRQDMMVMLDRALTVSGRNTSQGASLDAYKDRTRISGYALSSISRLVGEGIVEGSGSSLNPLGNASRAEAAVMMYRASAH